MDHRVKFASLVQIGLCVTGLLAISAYAFPASFAQSVSTYRYYRIDSVVNGKSNQTALRLDTGRVFIGGVDAAGNAARLPVDLTVRLKQQGVSEVAVSKLSEQYGYLAVPNDLIAAGADGIEGFVRAVSTANPDLYVSPVFYTSDDAKSLYIPLRDIYITFDSHRTSRETRRQLVETIAPEVFLQKAMTPAKSIVVDENDLPPLASLDIRTEMSAAFVPGITPNKPEGDFFIPAPIDTDNWLDTGTAFLSAAHNGFDLLTQANALQTAPGVLYATLNAVSTGETYADTVPAPWYVPSEMHNQNDRNAFWSLDDIQPYDMNATRAWGISGGGKFAPIAILDTGIFVNQTDLKNVAGSGAFDWNGKLLGGKNIQPTNGESDNPASYNDGRKEPHGTEVASVAAGRWNNGGGLGVSPDNQLLPINIFAFNELGGTYDDVYKSYWIAQNVGCRISNASVHLSDMPSSVTSVILAQTRGQGIIHFGVSSNVRLSSILATPSYETNAERDSASSVAPYNHPAVHSVSATDKNGALWISNTFISGWGRGIQFAAPGKDIAVSTDPNGRGTKSGTSLAAPYAAGVAALITQVNPSLNADEVWRIMATTATKTPHHTAQGESAPRPYNRKTGWGIVNADAATRLATGYKPTQIAVDANGDTYCLYTAYQTQTVNGSYGGGLAFVETYKPYAPIPSLVPTVNHDVRILPPPQPDWRCIGMGQRSDNRLNLFWKNENDDVRIETYDKTRTGTPVVTRTVNNPAPGRGGWGLIKAVTGPDNGTYLIFRWRRAEYKTVFMILRVFDTYGQWASLRAPQTNNSAFPNDPDWFPCDLAFDNTWKPNILWTNLRNSYVQLAIYDTNFQSGPMQSGTIDDYPFAGLSGSTCYLPPRITSDDLANTVDSANRFNPQIISPQIGAAEQERFTATQLCVTRDGMRYVLFKNYLGGTAFWAWQCTYNNGQFIWDSNGPKQWRYSTDTMSAPVVPPFHNDNRNGEGKGGRTFSTAVIHIHDLNGARNLLRHRLHSRTMS